MNFSRLLKYKNVQNQTARQKEFYKQWGNPENRPNGDLHARELLRTEQILEEDRRHTVAAEEVAKAQAVKAAEETKRLKAEKLIEQEQAQLDKAIQNSLKEALVASSGEVDVRQTTSPELIEAVEQDVILNESAQTSEGDSSKMLKENPITAWLNSWRKPSVAKEHSDHTMIDAEQPKDTAKESTSVEKDKTTSWGTALYALGGVAGVTVLGLAGYAAHKAASSTRPDLRETLREDLFERFKSESKNTSMQDDDEENQLNISGPK